MTGMSAVEIKLQTSISPGKKEGKKKGAEAPLKYILILTISEV